MTAMLPSSETMIVAGVLVSFAFGAAALYSRLRRTACPICGEGWLRWVSSRVVPGPATAVADLVDAAVCSACNRTSFQSHRDGWHADTVRCATATTIDQATTARSWRESCRYWRVLDRAHGPVRRLAAPRSNLDHGGIGGMAAGAAVALLGLTQSPTHIPAAQLRSDVLSALERSGAHPVAVAPTPDGAHRVRADDSSPRVIDSLGIQLQLGAEWQLVSADPFRNTMVATFEHEGQPASALLIETSFPSPDHPLPSEGELRRYVRQYLEALAGRAAGPVNCQAAKRGWRCAIVGTDEAIYAMHGWCWIEGGRSLIALSILLPQDDGKWAAELEDAVSSIEFLRPARQ